MNSKIYSIITAAKKSGLSPATIRKYCVNGALKSKMAPARHDLKLKKYEIKEKDLLKFLKENRLTQGPKESGTKIGPYRITRINGELVTERVG